MTHDQELWAVALLAEEHHGPDGRRISAEQVGRLALAGKAAGITLWPGIVERHTALQECETCSRA